MDWTLIVQEQGVSNNSLTPEPIAWNVVWPLLSALDGIECHQTNGMQFG